MQIGLEFVNIHILGCGNILKGDDGFGPAVVNYLEKNYKNNEDIVIVDAGLACGEWLTPMIEDEERPSKIFIIDVLDMDLEPGDIKILKPHNLQFLKVNFSSHFFPDNETFEELEACGVDITFVSCQLKIIPRDLSLELSAELRAIVPKAASIVAELAGMVSK